VIEIEHFVAAAQIDPVYYERPYILGAQPGGEHVYRVLLAALERAGLVGIGRVVLRSREQLVALRPHERALMLYTMRFADEVVRAGDLKVPALQREPSAKEITMAQRLIDTLSTDWRPSDHEDHYRRAVLDLIERKAAGESVQEPPVERERAPDDLLAALEASLEAQPRKRGPKRRASRTRGDTEHPRSGARR
jgi:DNA end-binding protein Ku